MNTHKTDTPLTFTVELAKDAGNLLCGFYSSRGIAARRKADQTLVTDADIAADQLIREALRTTFPDDAIVSEELSSTLVGKERAVWVIDPLDGTTNFSLGFPTWGVSIARLIDGYPSIGAVYFPLFDECYFAQFGGGSFLNGEPLSISQDDADWERENPSREDVFACCTRTYRHYDVQIPLKVRIIGSAAYNLCLVARGSAKLSLDVTAKVWDIAAAWLILKEAGGVVTCLNDPQPFPALSGNNYDHLKFPTMGASNEKLLQLARSKVVPRKLDNHRDS